MTTAPDLVGRVAVITGAAGGIGHALSRGFVQAGLKVVLCDNQQAGIARLHQELGAEHTVPIVADVSSAASCRDAVAAAVGRFGRVDVVVNNAALGMGLVRDDHFHRTVQIEDIAPETWARFMAVNLSGPFHMAHAAVPGMRRQGFGRIINVTTSFFTMLRPGFSPYGPAKAGLEAWTASLAGELKGTGITANVVVPGGPTDTPMVPADSGIDRSQMIRPERMVWPMLYLASDTAAATTGMRIVAAEFDPGLPPAAAAAKCLSPAAWPDLALNPVWPGGRPGT